MAKLLNWLAPHWEAFDELLLVKGKLWVDERAEARHHGLLKGLQLRKLGEYAMPGIEGGESFILQIRRPDEDD
jgi:16S rRNA (guanine527-N7)-methyltransferase